MGKPKWRNVDFGEFGACSATADLEGLAGIEECFDYGVLSAKKNKREKNNIKKPKTQKKGTKFIKNVSEIQEKNNKKKPKTQKKSSTKLTKNVPEMIGNFLVETVTTKPTPSRSSENGTKIQSIKNKINKKLQEEPLNETSDLNMQAWTNYGLPESIMKALADQGFSHPTAIQELTLPAAIHGKRDVLGAAETGSGKTLAFGIPIICGILDHKEKQSRGNVEDDENICKLSQQKSEEPLEPKIINFNKLPKDEIKKLRKIKKRFKRSKPFILAQTSSDSDQDSDSNNNSSSDCETESSDEENSDNNVDNDDERTSDDDNRTFFSAFNERKNNEMESDSDENLSDDDMNLEKIESDSDENLSDDNMSYEKIENNSDENLSDVDMSHEEIESNSDENLSDDDMSHEKIESDSDENPSDDNMSFEKIEDNSDENLSDDDMSLEKIESDSEDICAQAKDENGYFTYDGVTNVNHSTIIKNIKNFNLKQLYALILTPTRELAIQVKNHLVAAAKYTGIQVAVVVGGMARVKQERMLAKGPEIVVATPGRLWELIQLGNDHLSQVADIKFLAIDETDRMIERGHYEELHHLLDKINDNDFKRSKRQNFVFSATLTMVHDLPLHLKTKRVTKKGKVIKRKIEKLTSEQKLKKLIDLLGITNPKVVDVTNKNQGSSSTLTECRILCPIDHKDYYLYYILNRHPGRTIVFCNSIGCVKRLSQLFGILQCNPLALHASMQQRQRLKNLDRFKDNPTGLLIATDVAARGLDIPNVEHVIHYQVPRTAENYVHRSGRTARATKEGITILIMEPGEVQYYTKLCKTLSKEEDLPHFPVPDVLLTATKTRVNLARIIDKHELQMRKMNSEVGWYEKTMREMDIILDDDEKPQQLEKATVAEQKQLLSKNKKQLGALLSTPLFPKGFSFKFPTSNDVACEEMVFGKKQNALEVMKLAMEAGTVKKPKSSKEDSLLNSLKTYNLKTINRDNKNSKNKWKKNMKRSKFTKN